MEKLTHLENIFGPIVICDNNTEPHHLRDLHPYEWKDGHLIRTNWIGNCVNPTQIPSKKLNNRS